MIYTYDPQIYPRKVFVSIKESAESLSAHYKMVSDGETFDLEDIDAFCNAQVWDVVETIGDEDLGVLIQIKNPEVGIDVISHEATHAAWDILHDCGVIMDYDNQEPFAYLTGWIASKIQESIDEFNKI